MLCKISIFHDFPLLKLIFQDFQAWILEYTYELVRTLMQTLAFQLSFFFEHGLRLREVLTFHLATPSKFIPV
jgi:hypothetical protein